MRKFLILLILIFSFGCAHQLQLIDTNKGTILIGEFNTATKDVEVKLPSGEVLRGKYSAIANNTVAFGGTFVRGVYIPSTAVIANGGGQPGYAFLTGNKGTTMEVNFVYGRDAHGFGEAKTNGGMIYKVMF